MTQQKNIFGKIHQFKENSKGKRIFAILKFAILIIVLVGIPAYIFFAHHEVIEKLSDLKGIEAYFKNNKTTMIPTYILAQAIQIIICIIPGQWLQIGAGYCYGIFVTLIISWIGALIGSVITYYLARILGHDAMHLFFGEEKMQNMIRRLNSKRSIIVIFLIFLIPGVPKDLCNYAAGLSEIKLKPFLIVSMIGRTPGMLGSIIIGQQLNVGGYIGAIIVGAIAVVCFILGIVFRKSINAYLDKMYDKYMLEE